MKARYRLPTFLCGAITWRLTKQYNGLQGMREITGLKNRLMPIDSYERHKAVEQILGRNFSGLVLDAGGLSGALAQFMPPASIIALNVDSSGDIIYGGKAFPFAPASFDAVVSLDTVEHLRPNARRTFVEQCARTAKHSVIIAAPYGSAGHAAYEVRIDDLYDEIHGERHRWLHEHVINGLPSEGDLDEYRQLMSDAGFAVRSLYAGNYVSQCQSLERSLQISRRFGAAPRLGNAYLLLTSLALWHDTVFHEAPYDEANRFYLVGQRNGEVGAQGRIEGVT